MAAVTKRGPEVTLFNHETDELVTVPIRPERITEQVEVNYNRSTVIGLTHQPLQYLNTANRKLPNLTFKVDQHFAGEDEDILQFRHFLMAATIPEEGVGGPARITVAWPGVITFTAVLTGLTVNYERFADGDAGGVTAYSVTTAWEEWVPARRSADVYRRGVV